MSEPANGAAPAAAAEDFADLFENAPCGYLVLSADGAITRSNATFSRWMGMAAGDLVGKRLRDLLSIAGRIFYETNLAPLLRVHGGFEELALDLVTGDGDKLPVLINVSAHYADGEVAAIRVSVVRAKERRSYERDLLDREAAAAQSLKDEQSTSELREQFIAVLGHDLRNPLASIVGAARLLRREALSDKAVHVLQLMETSVDRMAGLIDDVMDFARGRLGGGIGLNLRLTPLEPVLRQVVSELEVDQPSRVVVCDFALTQMVRFDEGRIAQLVSNLLANAFTHGDPKQPVRLQAATRDGRLDLSVANAGAPIPPDAMDRLFQPFIRGKVQRNQEGLGLGLYIACQIAQAHGGCLTVQSDEAETRFTLSMPAA
ncbi:MAG: PAS domain-containing sensor histidine kinase [Caulobacteraceae bacterium]